jgi:hypothetical protein
VHLAWKKDAGIAVGQHQIGEDPGWRFDVQLEPQAAPVLAPVVPEIVPRLPLVELAQIDQISKRRPVRAERAGRKKG